MAVNDPNTTSAGRTPRAIVKLNGAVLDRWDTVKVGNNPGHYVSDMFVIVMPIYGQPDGADVGFYESATDLLVEISIGTVVDRSSGQVSNPTSMIIGPVDTIDADLMRGKLTLTGRDYSGAFIETVINENDYVNLTATQAAAQIISGHPGLIADIPDTSDATPIGIFANDPNFMMRLANRATEWDFLTALADREGFIIQVNGSTVYFGPAPDTSQQPPFVIKLAMSAHAAPTACNMKTVSVSRTLTFARDVVVTVHSFNTATKQTVTGSFKAVGVRHGSRAGGPNMPAQLYDITKPGLTQQQAQKEAEATARKITLMERRVRADGPGDPILRSAPPVLLTGTGTDADQTYYLERVEHRLDFDGGYEMTVEAKNVSPGTQFAAPS